MSESEIKILEALAKYKYLTVSQLDFLKILKNKNGLYERLRKLRAGKKPLIKNNIFGVYPGIGRLEDFYFLTKHGVNFLIENLEYSEKEIKAPKGTSSLFVRDYFHRLHTINFYLYFNKWLESHEELNLVFLDYYFDKVGNNRIKKNLGAKNKIDLQETGGFIIPDIITKFTYKTTPYLFFVEQHNGKDTKKLLKQLYYHLIAISEGAGAEKYNLNKSHRVAVLFEHESILKATIERLNQIPEFNEFEKFFIFKTNEDLLLNFYQNWLTFRGKKVNFI